jgi:hypothetical protein
MVLTKKMTLKSKRKRTTEKQQSNEKRIKQEEEQHETCVGTMMMSDITNAFNNHTQALFMKGIKNTLNKGTNGSQNLRVMHRMDVPIVDSDKPVQKEIGKRAKRWSKYYNALKQFKQNNGSHMSPAHSYKSTITHEDGRKETLSLGKWCSRQRQAKKKQKNGNITDDQIRKLDDIHFIWDIPSFTWNKYYNALKQFKQNNGSHMSPAQSYKSTITHEDGRKETLSLGKWCSRQRQAKKKKGNRNITDDQIRKLDDIHFIW